MQMHDNILLITGGTSGIGKGLAEAFHKLGNQVIISGRREDRLQEVCAANPGMRHFALDVRDPVAIRTVARKVMAEFPSLNCVFNNAGVQRRLELAPGAPLDEEGLLDEINTNLLGVIRVATEFIPHLVAAIECCAAQCLLRFGVCSAGAISRLLRHQGRRSFLHAFFTPPVETLGSEGG